MTRKISCPYHPTPKEKAKEMLRAAGLKSRETLYDLGSGEGNILIVGAEEFGANCIGIERDPKLVEKATNKVKERGLEDKIKIICDDVFSPKYWAYKSGKKDKYSIRNADVVALYLNFEVNAALRAMLEKELRTGARVVSFEFYIYGWKEIMDIPMIFVYKKGKSF